MSSQPRFQLDRLAQLLAPTVGDDVAAQALNDAARTLGIRPTGAVSMEQALDLLEQVATQPGIVGVTARFAKSRLHLLDL